MLLVLAMIVVVMTIYTRGDNSTAMAILMVMVSVDFVLSLMMSQLLF